MFNNVNVSLIMKNLRNNIYLPTLPVDIEDRDESFFIYRNRVYLLK